MEDKKLKVKSKKWIWTIIILLVVVLGGWMFINWLNRDIVTVKVATISRGFLEQVVTASGVIDAPVYELGTKMGGRIEEWKVKEGDKVRKGALLATFDNYEQASNDYQRASRLYNDGAASQQALDAANTMLDSSRIIAPNTGTVAKIDFDEGETVVPGQPAITIVNYDKSWVEAQIDEIDIANVKMGDKVKIGSDVYPDKVYAGEIYWIAPLAELRRVGGRIKMDEESYVFPCKVKFLGAHDELKVNMSVNVDVSTKNKADALIVPREALFSKDDSTYVYVVGRFNRVHEKKLTIGIRSFSSLEATEGVNEGEVLVVSNVNKLKDKGRIKVER